jgi:hypothetical protein
MRNSANTPAVADLVAELLRCLLGCHHRLPILLHLKEWSIYPMAHEVAEARQVFLAAFEVALDNFWIDMKDQRPVQAVSDQTAVHLRRSGPAKRMTR